MRIIRYLRVALKNAELEISEVIAFRWIFIMNIIVTLFAHILGPIVSVIIYTTTSGFPGWSLGEFIIFQGTSSFIAGIAHATVFSMVFGMSNMIESGHFDKFLIAPLRTIPYMLVSSFVAWEFGDILAGAIITLYGLSLSGIQVTLMNVVIYFYLILVGLLMFFGLACLIVSLNFKFIGVKNITDLFWNIMGVTKYPINIYDKWIVLIFTFILPISIANFYPAQALIGRLTDLQTIMSISIGVIVFVAVCYKILNHSIKNYSSMGG